jgi:hypothetical protein
MTIKSATKPAAALSIAAEKPSADVIRLDAHRPVQEKPALVVPSTDPKPFVVEQPPVQHQRPHMPMIPRQSLAQKAGGKGKYGPKGMK